MEHNSTSDATEVLGNDLGGQYILVIVISVVFVSSVLVGVVIFLWFGFTQRKREVPVVRRTITWREPHIRVTNSLSSIKTTEECFSDSSSKYSINSKTLEKRTDAQFGQITSPTLLQVPSVESSHLNVQL